jgi:hypothetical protein
MKGASEPAARIYGMRLSGFARAVFTNEKPGCEAISNLRTTNGAARVPQLLGQDEGFERQFGLTQDQSTNEYQDYLGDGRREVINGPQLELKSGESSMDRN